MSTLTAARHELAELLRADGIDAYTYPPETLSPPCVVVYPSDPFATPGTLGPAERFRMSVNYTLGCIVPALDNEAGLDACEALIEDVITALPPAITIARVSRPGLDDTGAQGSVYVAEVDITVSIESIP